jgi:hypothetical protein
MTANKPLNKTKPGDKRIGNQFWRLRSRHGRDKLFTTPELLWTAACEYFKWCESHPLYETKAFAYQGTIKTKKLPKMRAMTLSQLCSYLNTNIAYFRIFKTRLPEGETDFNAVIADIETTIYNQKFQGAAADLLNANIIARDLGLKEHSELTGAEGKPLHNTYIVDDSETVKILKELKAGITRGEDLQ